jgi:urease gamma subunit
MKETKELVIALALVGKLVVDRTKDGVDLADALAVGQALLADGALKDAVAAAVKDADKIDDEFKDFDLSKAMDLLSVVPQIVAIIKPPVV